MLRKKHAICETQQEGLPPRQQSEHRYVVPIVGKALHVLESLQNGRGIQKLEDIYRETGIPKATLYRILKTLVVLGYATETQSHRFKAAVSRNRKIQIGFGISNQDRYSAPNLLGNVRELADAWDIKLLVLDNEDGKTAAVRNASGFIRAQVEVVFESFVDPEFSPIVGEMLRAADRPTVTIESPLPSATYFGIDNYRAGFDVGERLVRFADRAWGGEADCFIGICSRLVDSAAHRIQGAFTRICSAVRLRSQERFEIVAPGADGNVEDRMRSFFLRHDRRAKVLILAADEGAEVETAKTVRQLRRSETTAIAAFRSGADRKVDRPDGEEQIVASVHCDLSSYARGLLQIGLAVRAGSFVPSHNYAKHVIVDHLSAAHVRGPSGYCVGEDLKSVSLHAS